MFPKKNGATSRSGEYATVHEVNVVQRLTNIKFLLGLVVTLVGLGWAGQTAVNAQTRATMAPDVEKLHAVDAAVLEKVEAANKRIDREHEEHVRERAEQKADFRALQEVFLTRRPSPRFVEQIDGGIP